MKRLNFLIIMVVIIIIISIGIIMINFYEKESKDIIIEKQKDPRISPYTDQAIFIEVKRIRHKGIIEQMTNTGSLVKWANNLNIKEKDWIIEGYLDGFGFVQVIKSFLPGKGWYQKPTFTYGVNIDGEKWQLPDKKFTTLDTEYIFHELYQMVEDEQKTSQIKFYIYEDVVEKKFLKEKISQKTAESFRVTYDYRNGTWTGDDYFNDTDGYGHYDGENYEIWFDIRQTDYDGDRIPFWTEVNILNTNPKINDYNSDPDGDNCSTSWEWKWGYNPNKWDNHTYLDPDKDGLQNIEEEYMEKWLANPFYPEIYIETDYSKRDPDIIKNIKNWKIELKPGKFFSIKRPTLSRSYIDSDHHVLWFEAKEMIIELFNQHGITVHIDDGNMLMGGGDLLPFISDDINAEVFAEPTQISEIYKKYFSDERKGIFRYLIICDGGGWAYNEDYLGIYDTMTVPQSTEFYKNVNLLAITERAQIVSQAISILHELGHTLGFGYLHWGGVDNMSVRDDFDKPAYVEWYDYRSVMNYYWYGCRYFNYSDGSHGSMDTNDWGRIDISYFQKTATERELEGIDFDRTEPPYNRGERD